MRKNIFTVVASILMATFCYAQDVIRKKSHEDIQAKVLELTTIEIKYKKFDNQSGPTYTIPKSEVSMIQYENGSKDIFNDGRKEETFTSEEADLYVKGEIDASRYYKGYKGAATGTLVTSLLSPLVGLIPAIACSSTTPNEINLQYPNAGLIKKTDYYNGYTKQAKKIKSGKVWKNFGIGLGVNLAAVLLLYAGG